MSASDTEPDHASPSAGQMRKCPCTTAEMGIGIVSSTLREVSYSESVLDSFSFSGYPNSFFTKTAVCRVRIFLPSSVTAISAINSPPATRNKNWPCLSSAARGIVHLSPSMATKSRRDASLSARTVTPVNGTSSLFPMANDSCDCQETTMASPVRFLTEYGEKTILSSAAAVTSWRLRFCLPAAHSREFSMTICTRASVTLS